MGESEWESSISAPALPVSASQRPSHLHAHGHLKR